MAANIHEIEYYPNIPSPIIPKYDTIQHLTVVSTYEEKCYCSKYEADYYDVVTKHIGLASSVAIDNATGHIYLSESGKGILEFTEYGEHILTISRDLYAPCGILIHEDFMYVTDEKLHAIMKFFLPWKCIRNRAGKYGSGNKELCFPSQIAMSPTQCIYVADRNNHRLQILSSDLVFQGTLQHQTLTFPQDVKFSNNRILVLSCMDNPCVHMFTLSGEKTGSIVTRGVGMQVESPRLFCIDACHNILVSDSNNIKVFSLHGELLESIGEDHYQPEKFTPIGIAILKNTKLVCTSFNKKFPLQILSLF